jgi:hypothetical protein
MTRKCFRLQPPERVDVKMDVQMDVQLAEDKRPPDEDVAGPIAVTTDVGPCAFETLDCHWHFLLLDYR